MYIVPKWGELERGKKHSGSEPQKWKGEGECTRMVTFQNLLKDAVLRENKSKKRRRHEGN